jgi:non-heme chloroperoxidase
MLMKFFLSVAFLLLSIFSFAETTVQMDFAVVEQGKGETMILVHGTDSDFRVWNPMLPALAKNFHVIAYSRRFHWPNAKPTTDALSPASLHADDLANFIASLDAGPVHVVGHSGGGLIALMVAKDHPELVRTLTVYEPSPAGLVTPEEGGKLLAERNDWNARVAKTLQADMKEKFMQTFWTPVLFPSKYKDMRPELRQMALDDYPATRVQYLTPPPAHQYSCEDAQATKVPVLAVSGGRSTGFFKLFMPPLERCLPNIHTVVLGKSGNQVQFDAPNEFANAIKSFIQDVEKNQVNR